METRNLTCIGCPLGCAITVTMDGGNVVSITGNTCKRGSDYAAKEVTHPTRIVTSTVCVRGGYHDSSVFFVIIFADRFLLQFPIRICCKIKAGIAFIHVIAISRRYAHAEMIFGESTKC